MFKPDIKSDVWRNLQGYKMTIWKLFDSCGVHFVRLEMWHPLYVLPTTQAALSFMKPFGCHVTILNTLDSLDKFDGKSDEGFFVGYSFSSKAFRVKNTRTRRVEENLHIGFLENKPMIEGNGPKWLFDIDFLSESMNYVPVAAGIIINESAGIQGELNAGTSKEISKYCIVIPIWKDASYFDSPSKDVDIGEPKSADDDQKQVEDGLDNENDEKDKSDDDRSPKEVYAVRLQLLEELLLPEDKYDNPYLFTRIYLLTVAILLTVVIQQHKLFVPAALSSSNSKNHLEFPDKVYKVEKALYGLHQAPRAWYETLSTYLLENRFRRGTIDKTLFIKKDKGDILLVQVYVDDIIFGSTKKSLCVEFEQMMHKRFQMSSMGELTFFLGLQVKQKDDGIFIGQDKYVTDILKKFDFITIKTASTPIETNKALLKDEEAKDVDVHLYRSMIRSLMYLTSSRPDIMFVICACARFQVTPKVSHLHVVKRIFRYLRGQPKFGLWYPRDSPFDLEACSDSDYAGASLDRKSTIGGVVDPKSDA
ncbi:uncharacterized mitochondrial protein-like protein [Tanacetum coccineum]